METSTTYSLKHVNCLMAKAKIEGFGDTDAIRVERLEGKWESTEGADGRSSRAYISSNAGRVTITLAQTSDSNATLSGLLSTDTATLKGQFPMYIHDSLGGSTYSASDCWVEGPPSVVLNKGIESYEWSIYCSDLAMYVAGNKGGFVAGAVNSISSALGLS